MIVRFPRLSVAVVALVTIACGGPASVTPAPITTGTARVTVQPPAAQTAPGSTVSFSAAVAGVVDLGVSWSVQEGPAGGSIDDAGHYTAPATPGTYHVVATSIAEPSAASVAPVTIGALTGAITRVYVNDATVAVNQSVLLVANVTATGDIDRSVTWSLGSGSLGTVDAETGAYTAPAIPGTYTVWAVSKGDSSQRDYGYVTVTSASSPSPGATYYVAHGGSDSAAGTLAAPWRTLRYAMRQLRAGDTLNIRGAPAGTSKTAACDGNDAGACWTETDGCGFGTCSPLHWDNAGVSAGTSDSSRVTVKAYQDEVVIIEPASGDKVVAFNPSRGPSSCSYVTLVNLILDGRHVSGETVRVDPETIYSNPDTGHCKYVNVNGGIIRHGKFTAGLALVGSYWTLTNVEFTENGTQTTPGDHDHAIYLQGIRNKFIGGRIHHNMQGVQCWNEFINGQGYQGFNEFRGVEVDHNGVNPWGGYVRNGTGPELGLYHDVCSYSVVDSCQVHDNTSGSIGVSGDWGPIPASYSTVSNNRIWSNGSDAIYIGNAVGTTLSGNVYSAP
jgi:hypothetical protein